MQTQEQVKLGTEESEIQDFFYYLIGAKDPETGSCGGRRILLLLLAWVLFLCKLWHVVLAKWPLDFASIQGLGPTAG